MRVPFVALACAAALTTGLARAESSTYSIDQSHTFVTFEVVHYGTSTSRGRFDKKDGTVILDRVAKTGKVDLSIDSASMNTGLASFDKVLQGANFLDAAKHPVIKFTSEQFVFNGDKVSEVVGNLTLLGQTHPVTLKASNFNCYANPFTKREVCGGDFDAIIQRSQWGMNYSVSKGIPDQVRLVIQVEAVKQP